MFTTLVTSVFELLASAMMASLLATWPAPMVVVVPDPTAVMATGLVTALFAA